MKAMRKQKLIQEFCKLSLNEQTIGIMWFVCNELKIFAIPVQRKAIQLLLNDKKPKDDMSGDIGLVIEHLNKLFCNNYEKFLRNAILRTYIKILPVFEKKCNRRVAEQEATDELLQLTVGKTAEQIRTMIKILKHNRRLRAA